jgi:hypothetical protein
MANKEKESDNIKKLKEISNKEEIQEEEDDDESGELFSEESEETIVNIWKQHIGDINMINVTMYNTTICLREKDFFILTKACNIATKKLLNLDIQEK